MASNDMTAIDLFDDLVATIASEQRAEFRAHYRALTRLPKANLNLQEFLDGFLEQITQLYAANAAAIWFRAPDTEQLVEKASLGLERVGLERGGLGGEFAEPHDRLLHFALGKRKSFLVKPFCAPEKQSPVSNPTDSFVVLGPVDHHGERIAVVELFLGPTPMRGRTAAERNRYVLWLDHLLGFLCRGIEFRLLRKAAPLAPALSQLAVVATSATELQATIVAKLERQLLTFAGWSFGTLEDNQAFAGRVHELLDQFGLRVSCPQCGAPAILRCQNTGNSKTGVFLFDHTLESGRTFHGGPTSFPRVSLVARPIRRKTSRA
jgi:hypothetical protein